MRRVLDLSGGVPGGAQVFRVRLHHGCLMVAHGTEQDVREVRVPAEDVAAVVLGPRTVATGAALGAVAASGGAVVVLDDRWLPSGILCPYAPNAVHAERLALQVRALPYMAPRLWALVVEAKLRAESALVPEAAGLRDLSRRAVADGDPENIEAQGARLYWPALMGEGFRRAPGERADSVNSLLDYGYAVLRAVVARAACAAGLHPALGMHHRGARNAFALADDLMEPLRPLVDRAVARADVPDEGLDRASKAAVLSVLVDKVRVAGNLVGVIEACEQVAHGLVRELSGQAGSFCLPEIA